MNSFMHNSEPLDGVYVFMCNYSCFEYRKAVIYTVVKVGGGTGQDPATEVTHLRLNQPPVFSSVMLDDFLLLFPRCLKQWRSQNEAEAGAQRGHTTFASSYPRTQTPPSFN